MEREDMCAANTLSDRDLAGERRDSDQSRREALFSTPSSLHEDPEIEGAVLVFDLA